MCFNILKVVKRRYYMIEGKKASIILILKVLEEYSDEEHFLKQQDIIDKVYELYQVELERKSVASSIKLLQELDYDINFVPKAGYALFSRKFDDAEVRFITDALMTSKSIDGNKAIKLSSKLNSCLSTYQRKGYGQIYKCNSFNRSNNKEIFLNLEVINEAKKKGKQISFQYLGYDSDAKLVKKKGGFRYRVSPYYSVYNNQFYYLLCNYSPKYRPINIFRLDNMVNIQIEEDYDLIPLNQFKGYENFDISTFVNDNVYALLGEVITATIELDRSE